MTLAQNATQAFLVLLAGMICWGLWPAMHKAAGKWRYELFYFDVAFGVVIAALAYAMTVGTAGFDGFSLQDDLMHAGKREWLMAFCGGAGFNLGNMILMAAVVVAGLSVALAIGLGGSLIIGGGVGLVVHNTASPLLVFVGSTCLPVAVVTMAIAY